MLNQDHPDYERLSALAAGDSDAMEDAWLNAHSGACTECSRVISELTVMRAALAELPDVAPHRPLRLLPTAEDAEPAPADRIGAWARRLFAPALTAGAALAMVGVVGTSLPALSGGAGGAATAGDLSRLSTEDSGAGQAAATASAAAAASAGGDGAESYSLESGEPGTSAGGEAPQNFAPDSAEPSGGLAAAGGAEGDQGRDATTGSEAPAERSPWPMVLFAGVALMIGAGLMRWILVPQSGTA